MSTEFEKDVERLVVAAFNHGHGVRDEQEKNDAGAVDNARLRELFDLRDFARKTVLASAPSESAPLLTAEMVRDALGDMGRSVSGRHQVLADRLNARLAHGEGKA